MEILPNVQGCTTTANHRNIDIIHLTLVAYRTFISSKSLAPARSLVARLDGETVDIARPLLCEGKMFNIPVGHPTMLNNGRFNRFEGCKAQTQLHQ